MAKKTTETKSAKAAAKKAASKSAKGAPSTKSRSTRSTGARPAKPVKGAKPAKLAPKEPKPPVKPRAARHPRARVLEVHGGKEALAKSLASVLARADEDAGVLQDRLKTASNAQLLRLARVSETVKQKWGSRDKLIEAIGTAGNKSKDQDYLTKLATYSLPQLVDLATSQERRART